MAEVGHCHTWAGSKCSKSVSYLRISKIVQMCSTYIHGIQASTPSKPFVNAPSAGILGHLVLFRFKQEPGRVIQRFETARATTVALVRQYTLSQLLIVNSNNFIIIPTATSSIY